MYFNISYNFSRDDIITSIARQIQTGKPGYICVADGNVLQEVHRNLKYRCIINGALFSICDSSWVPVFLRQLYGIEVKQYCGSDIFRDITGSGEYRQCFLGATREILGGLKERLSDMNPAYSGMMFLDLPFLSAEEFDYPAIARQIEEDGSDIIWVSLGAPKQEVFASELKKHLTKGIIIPVGAVFNFFSGVGVRRAPGWMIRSHMEFLYRLSNEPVKQAGRCLKILTALPGIVFEEKGRSNMND